uniref:Uncharacterized protein n=1 Tax=Oryza brachyantha TaxID=4533 RepID=J3MEX0_ORYBR
GAEVEGLEHGPLPLRHDADHQVLGERRRELLPLGEEVDGAVLHRLGDLEHGHRRRHREQVQLPRHHDAEALAAAAADGPEVVLAHGLPVLQLAFRVDHLHVDDVVGGEAELAQQHAEPAAAEVAADADGRAHAGRERQLGARLGDGVVELPELRAGVDPRRPGLAVDVHFPHLGEVDDGELLGALRPVRQPLVVVPAAARPDADAVAAGPDHGGPDVGGPLHRDDAQGRRRCRCVQELRVSDGGLEDGCVGRGAPSVYEPW